MGSHDFDRVEQQDGRYVLVCTCGWSSAPAPDAGAVGVEWDGHLQEVGVAY